MHVAINGHELPPKSLRSINLLDDGLSYTRCETKISVERKSVRKILDGLNNGDIVDYDLRASNNKPAKGKAHINRLVRGGTFRGSIEIMVYAFELEPVKEKEREIDSLTTQTQSSS